ncbi:hypothetical protein WKK05_17995 [Nostoc sp. UHCC 0302]|uniref:hypothetical protein n=1 Tax=Nostoc sp. UHCC 0302 TaxID=3134896 RepID=UPI00311C8BD7
MINMPKLNKIDFSVLIIVITIGLLNLPVPFWGDQALFTVGASEMHRGKLLYRDFWDIKQPGIYYFYLLAGTLFGFNEIGIHLFELIYMVFFSIILLLTLKSYFKHQVIASLVPLFTVGVYYIVSGDHQFTQVEALVGFPLFLCLWLTYQSFKYEGKQKFIRLLFSGFIGGIVLIFKLLFLPILLSFWIVPLLYAVLKSRKSFSKILLEICCPISIGTLLPIAFVISYFAWSNVLAITYQTFLVYPPKIATNASFDILQLFSGTRWFIQNFSPLIALAAVAIDVSLRKSKNLLTLLLFVWCLFGLSVIYIQLQSLWEYHYLLLFVPVGILATKGLDILWQPLKELSSTLTTIVLIFLLVFPLLFNLQVKSLALIKNKFALTEDRRINYQNVFRKDYFSLHSDVKFLSDSGSLSGDIFVAGDPSIYYLSGRNQATPLNTWSLELFLPEQWSQLQKELVSIKPPYIFISNEYISLVKQKSPQIMELINHKYKLLSKSNKGIWYILTIK